MSGENVVRLERLIPSPPEFLFVLWVTPEELVRWWAPDGYVPTVHALEARPGGRWRVSMRSADGHEVATSGVFRTVEPPRRLAFSWAWEDAGGARGHETEVTVEFAPAPGGTRLTVTQQSFESEQARDNHLRGWSASLDRQAKIMESKT